MPRLPSVQERPTPQPTGGLVPVEAGDVGRSVSKLGGAIATVGDALYQIDEQITKSRRVAQLTEMMGGATNDIGMLELQYERDSDFVTAPKRFHDDVKQIAEKYESQIDDELVKQSFRQQFTRLAQAKQLNVLKGSVKKEQDYRVAQFGESLDEYAKTAAQAKNQAEREAVIDQANLSIAAMETGMWITPIQGRAYKKAFEKQVEHEFQAHLFNTYQEQFLSSRDSQEGLKVLEKSVTQDKSLDDSRKNVLLGRILSRQDTLERRAEAEYHRRMVALERQISAVNSVTLRGYEPSTEQMAQLVALSKGTELEPLANQMVATAEATREFRNLLPSQQAAYLRNLEAQVRKQPGKFDVSVLDKFRQIHTSQVKQLEDDPIDFAARQGLSDVKPINFNDQADMANQLPERFALARDMAARYQAGVKPLTGDEATLLKAVIDKNDVAGQRNFFASLVTASGGDFEGYKAIMAQLSSADPVKAIAGVYAGRQFKTAEGKQTADLILRGQQILNPKEQKKVFPMPKDEGVMGLQRMFADYERNAFAGKELTRDAYYQTAKAVYAAKSVDEGDFTGELSTKRWRESMRVATGGIERYNGKSVVMPYGLDYGKFKDELKKQIHSIVASGRLAEGVTAARLRDFPVESYGDGKYVFLAGDGVLVGKDKMPIIVEIR